MSKQNKLYSSIRVEELTADMQLLSEVCGLEKVQSLLKEFQCLSFYFPKITRIDKFINRYLTENRERSPKELAMELGVSEQYIKRMLQSRFATPSR